MVDLKILFGVNIASFVDFIQEINLRIKVFHLYVFLKNHDQEKKSALQKTNSR